MNILIGITGSIAAYKTLELIRHRKRKGDDVKVMLTKSALNFTTGLACQTLSRNEVYVDQFVLTKGIKHITLSKWADVFVIAPATANIIGKAANGVADDLLSTTIVSFGKPILFVPAMDTGMWDNTIVQQNVQQLRDAGYHVMEPGCGALASGKIGRGRFPDVDLISRTIDTIKRGHRSLQGHNFLVSGGRTEEDIDPVRVLTNRSSGTMARELLYAIAARGGNVRCVMGKTGIPIADELNVIKVRTAKEMLKELKQHVNWCNCLIMVAAIGDYKPQKKSTRKVHDRTYSIRMKKNKDLLAALIPFKGDRYYIGFSLEDEQAVARGRKKLKAKGLDLIVLNNSAAIGQDKVRARLLRPVGKARSLGMISKQDCAHYILNAYLDQIDMKG